jgi:hypothetical protein
LANIIIANLTYRFGATCFDDDSAWNNSWTQSYIKQIDFIPLAIETYGCFHPCFHSFFTSCVHANIVHHWQNSLIPSMFIFNYMQRMSIALQHAQAIMILQWATMFSHSYSSFPNIPTSSPPSLVDLWQRMPF